MLTTECLNIESIGRLKGFCSLILSEKNVSLNSSVIK